MLGESILVALQLERLQPKVESVSLRHFEIEEVIIIIIILKGEGFYL